MGLRDFLNFVKTIITTKWFWIIVTSVMLTLVLPFLMVIAILYLPTPINAITLISIVIAWGIVSGYKDWIKAKNKEEELKK